MSNTASFKISFLHILRSHEDPGDITYAGIGGLSEQIRELREVIELPLLNPELFQRVGITPPKGCLLYGPPGTGKTLLARAVASQLDANFLKVVSSAIVDKYIGNNNKTIYRNILPLKTNKILDSLLIPFIFLIIILGESARLIREMFNYARDHQPCIIFMDEIDAIGGRRFSEGKIPTVRTVFNVCKYINCISLVTFSFCKVIIYV